MAASSVKRRESGKPAAVARRGARAWALIVLGGLALLDAAVTMVWQEPFSALYAKLRQDSLSGTLRRVERAPPTIADRRVLASLPDQSRRIAYLARALERRAAAGGPVAPISIPLINASFVVVKGTSTSDLESGPGIYPE